MNWSLEKFHWLKQVQLAIVFLFNKVVNSTKKTIFKKQKFFLMKFTTKC